MMWWPVVVVPTAIPAGVAAVFSARAARTVLPLTSAAIVINGVQGTYLHGLFTGDAFRSAYLAGFGLASTLAYEAQVERALDALAQHAPSWPADAQERLQTVRQAARDNPAAAATSVIFLKNVLIREPEYRAALAAVSTPRAGKANPTHRLASAGWP